jgi:hypothetical protein
MEPLKPGYWLPHHVYVCRVDEAVIFLNTQTDKYGAVVGEQMRSLGAVVHGWPAEPPPGCEEFAREIAEQLVKRGILTTDAAGGKPATPTGLTCSAVSVAVGIDLMEERAIRLWDIVNFLVAWLRASLSLRWRGLQKTVDAVHARKLKHAGAAFDVHRAVELVCVFRRLRCYFVVLRERCLLHSLVLTNFLASYGLFPTFVMAVKLQPWGAHSWVQQDEFVLNGTPASIRDYTPIVAT